MKKFVHNLKASVSKKFKRIVNRRILAIHIRQFLFIFLLIMIGVMLQILVVLNSRYAHERKNYLIKNENYAYWQGVANQFPNAPDILYNAAVSAFEVGNRDQAFEYLERALLNDPLFEKAKLLREKFLE